MTRFHRVSALLVAATCAVGLSACSSSSSSSSTGVPSDVAAKTANMKYCPTLVLAKKTGSANQAKLPANPKSSDFASYLRTTQHDGLLVADYLQAAAGKAPTSTLQKDTTKIAVSYRALANAYGKAADTIAARPSTSMTQARTIVSSATSKISTNSSSIQLATAAVAKACPSLGSA